MNTTPNPDAPQVVVVGAGPVGLVAACELARHGVRVRIFDKLSAPTDESRAIAMHARSLDMLDRMGVARRTDRDRREVDRHEHVRQGQETVPGAVGHRGQRLPLHPGHGADRDGTGPRRAPDALGVTVERGVEVVALTQDDDAVHLTVRHADGSTGQVETSWVVAADGGHSTVRHLVGTKLEGSFKGERFILGDVECDHHLDNTNMYTFFSPEGPVVTLPMRGGRVRFLAQIHDAPGAPLNLHPTQEQLQTILDQRVGGDHDHATSHWLTCFEIHHGQVPAYRHGRVFLAGDAAHIHSPAGGQGMNTGMQDAFNLGWKLAAVRGDGGQTLLDSYHTERHPIAEGVIDFTGMLTKVGTLKGAARVLRNAVVRVVGNIGAVDRKMASVVEETTVSYEGSPIAVGHRPHGAKVTAGEHIPHVDDAALQKQLSALCSNGHTVLTVAAGRPAPAAGGPGPVQVLVTDSDTPVAGYDGVVADPKGLLAERLGLGNGGRVVVRPDGYLGAITALDDSTGVADYFAQIAR